MQFTFKMSRTSEDSSPELSSSYQHKGNLKTLRSTLAGSSTSTTSTSSSNSSTPGNVSFIKDIQIEDEFKIIRPLSEGTFSKILLAKRRSDNQKLVLKAINCDLTSAEDFNREVNLTYFLSPHPNVITCFNVCFLWNNSFLYVQEHAPFGPLSRLLSKGLPLHETTVKLLAQQLTSALEFIHGLNIVHGDIIPENILVFKSNLSQVKLSDFGTARTHGSLMVMKSSNQIPHSRVTFAPPEICDLLPQEKYYCDSSSDVWQMGILLFTCLTGGTPWDCADIITDPCYRQYCNWIRRKSLRMPEALKPFSPRFLRMFKRLIEPKASNRSEVREIMKYLKDDWVIGQRMIASSASSMGSQGSLQNNVCIKGKRHCEGRKNSRRGIQAPRQLGGSLKGLNLLDQSEPVDKKKVLDDWLNNASLIQHED